MNKEILRTIGKRGNQYNNNEYDMDYNVYDDYTPKSRYHYETPYQHPRELSILTNLLNLNNNLLTNKNQLNNRNNNHLNYNKNKETSSASDESNKKLGPISNSDPTADNENEKSSSKIIPSGSQSNSSGKSINNPNPNYPSNTEMDEGNTAGLLSDANPSIQDQSTDNDLQMKYLYSLYRNRYENF